MNCDPTHFSALVRNHGGSSYRVNHAALRGANWFGLGPNPLVFWTTYEPRSIASQLDLARFAHINSLRVFLSYEAYSLDPTTYLRNLNHLLGSVCERGIILLVVVTDFCFGWNGKHAVERWAGTPGVFFMEKLPDLTAFASYLDQVLAVTRQYPPWLVMFDLANEPSSNPWARKDPLGSGVPALTAPLNILLFLNAVLTKLFADAAAHEITIGEGLIAQFGSPEFLAQYPFTFQSIHGGYGNPADIVYLMETIPPTSLRPVVLTETAADPAVIPAAVAAANQFHVGFMFWGLMKGFNQWNSWTGLFFPDGSVTNLAALEALRSGPAPGVVEVREPPGFVVMNEKVQIRKALTRLHRIEEVTADNADEMRSLPWELLFWGFFEKHVDVHERLLAIHQVISAAFAVGDTPQAYAGIKEFVAVAHRWDGEIDMHVEPPAPQSKGGPVPE